jgi:hypothetical protein
MVTKLEKIALPPTKIYKSLAFDNGLSVFEKSAPLALFVHVNDGGVVRLVFSAIDTDGKPVGDSRVALELPCPPYCGTGGKGGNENGNITVVTVD